MIRLVASALLVVASSPALIAEDLGVVHASVRQSLAYIEVSGQRSNGVPLENSGTGVLLDSIGHVLTVAHIVTDIESQALDGKVEITVHIGERDSNPRKAIIVRKDGDRDALVLRINTSVESYKPACFGDETPVLPAIGTNLLTSGFPIDVGYFTGSGLVTTTDGPRSLFGVDISISSGQSGSPLYDINGNVLGVVIGSIEGEGISGQHYFRPTRHIWDIVLPYAYNNCGGKPVHEIRGALGIINESSAAASEAMKNFSNEVVTEEGRKKLNSIEKEELKKVIRDLILIEQGQAPLPWLLRQYVIDGDEKHWKQVAVVIAQNAPRVIELSEFLRSFDGDLIYRDIEKYKMLGYLISARASIYKILRRMRPPKSTSEKLALLEIADSFETLIEQSNVVQVALADYLNDSEN